MHLETLKTFCDLIDGGSFGKAAALNLVSQSAVSQQIRALELRFGRRLVERGGRRGVTPTDAGRVLYAGGKAILERFRALDTELAGGPRKIDAALEATGGLTRKPMTACGSGD